MRTALIIAFLSVAGLCYTGTAYAAVIDDIFLKFMYGTIGLALLGFTGCITFITYKFNQNVGELFQITQETKKEVSDVKGDVIDLKSTCRERSKHCPATSPVIKPNE